MSSLLIQSFTDHWEKLAELKEGDPFKTFPDYSSGKKEMYAIICCKYFANFYKMKGNIQDEILSNRRMIDFRTVNSIELVKKLDTDNPCYEQSMKASEINKLVLIAFTYLS